VSVVDQYDALGEGDRAGAVSDDDRRAPTHHGAHRLADLAFLGRVHGTGCVVEHEHSGIGHDRPCDGDALPLATAQGVPPLTDHGVVAVGQSADELVCPGQSSGALEHLLGSVRHCESDVAAHSVVEQQRVLEHDAHGAPQRGQLEVAHIDTIDSHRAGVDIVEPGQEASDRRLAAPRLADDGDRRACLDMQREPVKHRQVGLVAEAHVVELDRTRPPNRRLGRCRIGDLRPSGQHVVHTE
jgi:hypothetical protein